MILPKNLPDVSKMYDAMIKNVNLRITPNGDKTRKEKILEPLLKDIIEFKNNNDLEYSASFVELMDRVREVMLYQTPVITRWVCGYSPKLSIPRCEYTTESEEEINYHKSHIHGSKCVHKDCDFADMDIRIVERHMKAVHNSNLWLRCKICNEKITGVDEFDKHLEFTHGKPIWSAHLGIKEARRMIQKMRDNLE